MLAAVCTNDQLVNPVEKISGNAVVLVLESGVVFVSVNKKFGGKQLKGNTLGVFDIQTNAMGADSGYFSSVDSYIKTWLHKIDKKLVYECLRNSQSITIAHISRELKVNRDVAKDFVSFLVSTGAYVRYFTYWRRSQAFAKWTFTMRDNYKIPKHNSNDIHMPSLKYIFIYILFKILCSKFTLKILNE